MIDRSQGVSVSGTLSDEIMATSGVSYGSGVLSLLLFYVYIDEMLSLPECSSFFCFADDTNLACLGEDIFSNYQEDIDKLFTLEAENDLALNVEKWAYLQISENCECFQYWVQLIRAVDKTNYLGIEISSNLKWSKHVRANLPKAQNVFFLIKNQSRCSLLKNLRLLNDKRVQSIN